MTDKIEDQMTPRPWANAVLRAIITQGDTKSYLYTMSPTEIDQPELVLGSSNPDLATETLTSPPFFQYEVGLGMIGVVCVEVLCAWAQSVGASVESYI